MDELEEGLGEVNTYEEWLSNLDENELHDYLVSLVDTNNDSWARWELGWGEDNDGVP